MNRALSKRIFVAINLPDQAKDYLVGLQKQAQALGFPIRPVDRANLHLTLVFLGTVGKEKIPTITSSVAEAVRGKPDFPIQLGRTAVFTSLGKLSSWHVSLLGNAVLSEIFRDLTRKLLAQRFTISTEHKFEPHITLGRFSASVSDRLNVATLLELPVRAVSFRAMSLDVMESDLRSRPPRYYLIKALPFSK